MSGIGSETIKEVKLTLRNRYWSTISGTGMEMRNGIRGACPCMMS